MRLPALLVLLALVAAPASAASWSAPAAFDRPGAGCTGPNLFNCLTEPAPRTAVNARGDAAVAWVIGRRDRVHVAFAPRGGAFGRVQTVGSGLRPVVAVSAAGRVTVAWTAHRAIWFARGTSALGTPRRLAAPVTKEGDDDARLAVRSDGSVDVVYEQSYRTAAGRYHTRFVHARIGTGDGVLDHDSFRAGPGGTAAVCCVAGSGAGPLDPRATIGVLAPATGWRVLASGLPASGFGVETVAADPEGVALGVLELHNRGDAGSLGVPGVVRIDASGVAGALRPAPVVHPGRGLHPVVAIDGAGRDVLVYQEKTVPKAFSREAPVYAVTAAAGAAFGARQRLDAHDAYEPTVRRLPGGAIAAWERGGRWHVAVETGGRFRAAAAPSGSVSRVGEDFNYNRDLATGGRHAVLAWIDATGAVRASIGHFG